MSTRNARTTDASVDFACCDTTWHIRADGAAPAVWDAVEGARQRVLGLAAILDAFDPKSAVGRLNRGAVVDDAHVAALVERGEEYHERTRGVFSIVHGSWEHAIKRYIRGSTDASPVQASPARYGVRGSRVATSAPLDLNGLAKGYIVDRAQAALDVTGVHGFVDGGGDIARPTGPVAIDAPGSPERTLGILDTRWNVATSGNSKRQRGRIDHIYDPRSGRVGARHEQVTVVARRDCMEADALATVLAAMSLDEGHRLVAEWPGLEALWVTKGRLVASDGFGDHVWKA